jgi:hypothetical protein
MTQEYIRQALEMALSWIRVFAAASLAVYSVTGIWDLQLMANAGIAALLPMVLRFLDSGDPTYGRGTKGNG